MILPGGHPDLIVRVDHGRALAASGAAATNECGPAFAAGPHSRMISVRYVNLPGGTCRASS